MEIAKGLMKRVVEQARRVIRECALKWFSCISRKRTFKEFEEDPDAEEENNMQNAEQEQRKRARTEDIHDYGRSRSVEGMDDGTLVSTPESQWSPIQFPITGGRQLLKRRNCSYMPLRMTRQRTSSDSPLVIKKPMETEKQGVLLAYELLVPQKSREMARKILEHCAEQSLAQLKSNDDCQTSLGSSEHLASTIKENTMPISSSNDLSTSNLATPALAISHCNIYFGPGGASSDVTNAIKRIPIVPKRVEGFRLDLSDLCWVPEKKKGFRMCLSEESDDEDQLSDDEDHVNNCSSRGLSLHCLDEHDDDAHVRKNATRSSALCCLVEPHDDDHIRNNTTGSSAFHCLDGFGNDDHVNHDVTRGLHSHDDGGVSNNTTRSLDKSYDDHHVSNSATASSALHCIDVQNKSEVKNCIKLI